MVHLQRMMPNIIGLGLRHHFCRRPVRVIIIQTETGLLKRKKEIEKRQHRHRHLKTEMSMHQWKLSPRDSDARRLINSINFLLPRQTARMMMGFIRIGENHPLSHLVVQNPHYVASACETCEICKQPFNFTNMDLHIEGGCAEKLMKLRKEREAKERANGKKMGLKVPKVKICKKPIARPQKKDDENDQKRKPLSNTKVSITVHRCKPMHKSKSRRLHKK